MTAAVSSSHITLTWPKMINENDELMNENTKPKERARKRN